MTKHIDQWKEGRLKAFLILLLIAIGPAILIFFVPWGLSLGFTLLAKGAALLVLIFILFLVGVGSLEDNAPKADSITGCIAAVIIEIGLIKTLWTLEVMKAGFADEKVITIGALQIVADPRRFTGSCEVFIMIIALFMLIVAVACFANIFTAPAGLRGEIGEFDGGRPYP